jgi:hypothetical protein
VSLVTSPPARSSCDTITQSCTTDGCTPRGQARRRRESHTRSVCSLRRRQSLLLLFLSLLHRRIDVRQSDRTNSTHPATVSPRDQRCHPLAAKLLSCVLLTPQLHPSHRLPPSYHLTRSNPARLYRLPHPLRPPSSPSSPTPDPELLSQTSDGLRVFPSPPSLPPHSSPPVVTSISRRHAPPPLPYTPLQVLLCVP